MNRQQSYIGASFDVGWMRGALENKSFLSPCQDAIIACMLESHGVYVSSSIGKKKTQ